MYLCATVRMEFCWPEKGEAPSYHAPLGDQTVLKRISLWRGSCRSVVTLKPALPRDREVGLGLHRLWGFLLQEGPELMGKGC